MAEWNSGARGGTTCRELLDHVIVFDEQHLRRSLGDHVSYCSKRMFRFGMVLVVASLLSLQMACREDAQNGLPYSGTGSQAGYSLIWVSLDTVRADHLGIYGYERPTTPFIDELARTGMYFEWAIAPTCSTLPSHMTMFTGYHPAVHKIMHSFTLRLAPRARTLTQILEAAGFATRAWVDGGKMNSFYGFSRGFTSYDERRSPFPEKLHSMLDTIDRTIDAGMRFFFFVHTYQAHFPYSSPKPFDTRFVTPGKRDTAQIQMDKYDGAIAFVDESLRQLVAQLEKRDLLKSTILVITGDHGESFREYGIDEIGHGGHNLHQSITRVPWIMLHPSPEYRGLHVRSFVGLIDFPNTVLSLLGLEPSMPGGGVNVLDRIEDPNRSYVSWTGEAWSLYSGRHHLLYSEDREDVIRNRLFDVSQDPRERRPIDDRRIHVEKEALLLELQEDLGKQSEQLTPFLRVQAVSPQELNAQLKALGYVK